jgi:hypothetical protein
MKKKTAAQSWDAIQPKATWHRLGPLAKTARPAQQGHNVARALGVVTAHGAQQWRN